MEAADHGRIPAAMYLRVSSDTQMYSIARQRTAILAYAEQHDFNIVDEYVDEGKSGLTLAKRPGLTGLLKDVVGGEAKFAAVLAYDVSRWGRFQDIDESAHYEFICRCAGVQVHYCAESFDSDDPLRSSILKSLKRSMAAEYSRELSRRLCATRSRMVRLGFSVGGPAPYGVCRVLVDNEGNRIRDLAPGERKNRTINRVIFGLGPAQEVATVRRIFELVVNERYGLSRIARELNDSRVTYRDGTPWTASRINHVLCNRIYTGLRISGRSERRLGQARDVPKEGWLVMPAGFPPIISPETFEMAQQRRPKQVPYEDGFLIEHLRHLLQRHGQLSTAGIERSCGPSYRTYVNRFGGLRALCELLGWEPPNDVALRRAENAWRSMALRDSICAEIQRLFPSSIRIIRPGPDRCPRLQIENTIVAVRVSRASVHKSKLVWRLGERPREIATLTLVARLRPDNSEIDKFYLFPAIKRSVHAEEAHAWWSSGRELSLPELYAMVTHPDRVLRASRR